MAASVNGNVPLNYEKAIVSVDLEEKWQAAMQNEINSLKKNMVFIASTFWKTINKKQMVFRYKA